jgi:hypothetical protein
MDNARTSLHSTQPASDDTGHSPIFDYCKSYPLSYFGVYMCELP